MFGGGQGDRGRRGGDTLSIRTFADAGLDGIWVLTPDGEIEYRNPRAQALHETASAAGVPVNLRQLWPQESRCALEQALTSAAGGQASRFLTFTEEAAGTRTDWEVAITPVRKQGDAVTYLMAIARDVTEQHRAAQQLRVALAAAQQASEAKSTFLTNISHELRTPLNGIVAGAEILARADLPERWRQLAQMIHGSGQGLTQLVSDILDLARIEEGQVQLREEAFDIADLARSTAALFTLEAARKGVVLDVQIAPQLGLDSPVRGDPHRLRQVLGNLLGNAVKFTERGGIALRVSRTWGRIRFDVIDTGVGFDPAVKARLFTRFQQADNSITRRFAGAGLGLAISRQLVELMGGTIDCDSAEGVGSTFWFTVPLPSARGAANDQGSPEKVQWDGLRVLLADDHPVNRQVVQIMLSATSDVVAVENGAEAVSVFAASGPFDLVLMDMQMPVMDGLAAVSEIRRLEAESGAPRTPIIMLTANAAPEHVRAGARAGADHHLCKPVTAKTLIGAISEVRSASRRTIPCPAQAD